LEAEKGAKCSKKKKRLLSRSTGKSSKERKSIMGKGHDGRGLVVE